MGQLCYSKEAQQTRCSLSVTMPDEALCSLRHALTIKQRPITIASILTEIKLNILPC